MKYVPLLAIVLAQAITLPAHAKERALQRGGDKGGNGGDPVLLRAKLIRQFISTELRGEVRKYIDERRYALIQDAAPRADFDDMLGREYNLSQDVLNAEYRFASSCKDQDGQEKSASSIPGDLGGSICFNPMRLAEESTSKAELIGLAVHEHAHHFTTKAKDYSDKEYVIYKAVFDTVSLIHPAWGPQGPGGYTPPTSAKKSEPSVYKPHDGVRPCPYGKKLVNFSAYFHGVAPAAIAIGDIIAVDPVTHKPGDTIARRVFARGDTGGVNYCLPPGSYAYIFKALGTGRFEVEITGDNIADGGKAEDEFNTRYGSENLPLEFTVTP
jgi:hypothetical protein